MTGTFEAGGDYTTQIPTALQDIELATELQANDVQTTGEPQRGTTVLDLLLGILPFLIFIGFYLLIARRTQRQVAGGVGSILGSRAKVYDAERPTARFSDVAGYEREAGDQRGRRLLAAPRAVRQGRGDGTAGRSDAWATRDGKTLLARAIAGEAGVPFLAITGRRSTR